MKITKWKITAPVILLAITILILPLSGCVKPPIAGIMIEKDIALAGDTIQFSDQSSENVTSWLWDFGDGNTSGEQNPSHVYTEKGSYTVSLTASNKASSNIATDNITIIERPVAKISTDAKAFAVSTEVIFTDTSTGDISSRSWDFGDGSTSDEQNPVHIYSETGVYCVTLTVTNKLINNATTIEVKILDPPVASFSLEDNVVACNAEIKFTDTSTGDIDSYLWDFGDGTTSTEQNPTHKYNRRERFYAASLTVSNAAATNTTTQQIEVLMTVEADFSAAPVRVLFGQSIDFKDTSTGDVDSWLWDFGDGTTSTQQNPSHVYETGGVYTIIFTASNAVGSDTKIKDNYITITTLFISPVIMCSDVTVDGKYTEQTNAKFHSGDMVWVYFQVNGIQYKEKNDGDEIWVTLTTFKVSGPDDELINLSDSIEFHDTIPEANPLTYLWFRVPVGYVEPDDPIGNYMVTIWIKDNIANDNYLTIIFFSVVE